MFPFPCPFYPRYALTPGILVDQSVAAIPIGPSLPLPRDRASSTTLLACSLVWSRHPGRMTRNPVTDLLRSSLRTGLTVLRQVAIIPRQRDRVSNQYSSSHGASGAIFPVWGCYLVTQAWRYFWFHSRGSVFGVVRRMSGIGRAVRGRDIQGFPGYLTRIASLTISRVDHSRHME